MNYQSKMNHYVLLKYQYKTTLIIKDHGDLGIAWELTSDFIDSVNTINNKADKVIS